MSQGTRTETRIDADDGQAAGIGTARQLDETCQAHEPKNLRSLTNGTCRHCSAAIYRLTAYSDPPSPWLRAPIFPITPEDPEQAARRAAIRAFLEGATANYMPIRDRFNALGPFTIPERCAVRSHRLGQAFELVVSLLAIGRWPEANRRLTGYLAPWLREIWSNPTSRRAALDVVGNAV